MSELTERDEQLASYQSADELREETWAKCGRITDTECERLYGWLQETGGKTALIISLELMRTRKAEERLTMEVEEWDQLLVLRNKAERRAIERWREEHDEPLTLPDTSDLTLWLIDKWQEAEAKLENATRTLDRKPDE